MTSPRPIDRLLALPAFATSGDVALKPGFERIEALLDGMGRPDTGREIVLVAGTNGKGSTASMLAALSTAAGVRTGLHTSPHLVHVGERMRVDGAMPSEEWLDAAIERWEPLFEQVQPSFFEATLALSLHWFGECDARRWVVEIGLGGRLDAANVLDADLGILTSVGRDHMHLLGPTLADVAREKAAIARPDKPFVLGPLNDEARESALTVLGGIGARVIEPDPSKQILEADGLEMLTTKRQVSGIFLPLTGAHQRVNALLALEALDQLDGAPVDEAVVRTGFRGIHALSGLRARQEWVKPDVMVDVGHNEEALRSTLSSFLRETEGHERTIILGFLADKELGALGTWLGDRVAGSTTGGFRLVFVETDGARGLSAVEAARRWAASGWQGAFDISTDIEGTLRTAADSGRKVLIAGSYRVASRALEVL